MDNNILLQLLDVLKNKKIKGIRKTSDSSIILKFQDDTEVSIYGGSVDYGEIDVLEIGINDAKQTSDLIIGEW